MSTRVISQPQSNSLSGTAFTVGASPIHKQPGQAPPPAPNSTTHASAIPAAVVLANSEGVSKSLALRQRFTKTDPRYVASFGDVKFERSTKSGLKLTGWVVVDLVERIWSKLQRPVASLIMGSRQDWENQRPQHRTGGQHRGSQIPGYGLRCFLLGPDKGHATPYVAILCDETWFQRAAARIIIKSELLAADGFQCFGLPDKPALYMATHPDVAYKPELYMATEPDASHKPELYVATEPGAPPAHPQQKQLARLTDFELRTPEKYKSINGVEVDVILDGTVVSQVTIGGVILIGEARFGMTVRHAFQYPARTYVDENSQEADEYSPDTETYEIDLFDDLIIELDDKSPSVEPDLPDLLPSDRLDLDERTDVAQIWDVIPASHELNIHSPNLTHLQDNILSAPGAMLDWALKFLPAEDDNQHFVETQPTAAEDQIVIKTSSNLLYGGIGSSGVLGIPTTTNPQPVVVASIMDVKPGECGSWAMTLKDGTFTGMLIGACPTLKEVYLLRMADILQDIHDQTDFKPTIPPPQRTMGESGNAPARGGGVLSFLEHSPTVNPWEPFLSPNQTWSREYLQERTYRIESDIALLDEEMHQGRDMHIHRLADIYASALPATADESLLHIGAHLLQRR